MAIHGCDYMGIYDLLSPEEKMVQESVSDFVDNEVLPIIEKHYQAGTFPMHLAEKMAELGVFGITLPEQTMYVMDSQCKN